MSVMDVMVPNVRPKDIDTTVKVKVMIGTSPLLNELGNKLPLTPRRMACGMKDSRIMIIVKTDNTTSEMARACRCR